MLNKTFRANSAVVNPCRYIQASLNIKDAIPTNNNTSFKLMLYFNKENSFNYLSLAKPDDYTQYYIIQPNIVIGDVSIYTAPNINQVDTAKNISITKVVAGLTNAPSNNIPLSDGPIPMELWTGFTGNTPGFLTNTINQVDIDYKSQVVELGRKPIGFPNRSWNSIDSNLVGDRLVASAYDDYLYVSRDYGMSWTQVQTRQLWTSVATNDSGSIIAATTNGGQIYVSADYGNSWTNRDSNRFWSDIDTNALGNIMVATVNNGFIYQSTNTGTTWTPVLSDISRAWSAITSNDTGTKLVATVNGGYIYYSTNSGTTWNVSAFDSLRSWSDVKSDRSGTNVFAAVSNGFIYKSSDSGANWFPVLSDVSRNWSGITLDHSGQIVYATLANSSSIFVSINGGATWNEILFDEPKNWSAIATNANGSNVIATVFDGKIYSTQDNGENWFEVVNEYVYLGLYIEGLTPNTSDRNDSVIHVLIQIYE
jgi:photosystem II stability/assembly factor-like uncharacterized protein